ncbi:helix-turn-helix domain-containing protein [Dactylosporangium sp. NPDC000521]|uniref:helix-turn-helix domain-containing protein n=1 Tax=Dactylosporangium sp. NPDC000521 TaxID=3363975 RepID=UPI0036A0673A
MGRPQNPVDPTDPQLAEFISELRELRRRAGLNQHQLATALHFSKSKISTAESGRRLPSWPLVKAYVVQCSPDADVAAWQRRWEKLKKRTDAAAATRKAASVADAARSTEPAVDNRREPRRVRPRGGAPDTVAAFLADLRSLIDQHGMSLRAVATAAGCAVSTVSTTLSGGALPRWDRIASMLGAVNVAEPELGRWQERWQGLRQEQLRTLQAQVADPVTATSDRSGSSSSEQEDPFLDALAAALRQQYRSEARTLGLDAAITMPVTWMTTGAPLADHWSAIRHARVGADLGPLDLHGTFTELADVYRQIPSQRLVVLGEPGSGKSSLLLRLALELLAARRPGGTVPVLLDLGRWNPQVTPLSVWICDELATLLPGQGRAARPRAQQMLDGDGILPVLDGLDEMPAPIHQEAIRQLNETARPVVVACRTAEFTEAVMSGGIVVRAAAVIALQPLTVTDAMDYLRRTAPPGRDGITKWELVLHHLRQHPDSPLARVLSTPLMVRLAQRTYNERGGSSDDPASLLDKRLTPEDVEDKLLDAFVPASYSSGSYQSGGSYRFGRVASARWLGHIARSIEDRGKREIAVWRLGEDVHPLVCGLLTALATAAAALTGLACARLFAGAGLGLAGSAMFAGALFGVAAVSGSALHYAAKRHGGRAGRHRLASTAVVGTALVSTGVAAAAVFFVYDWRCAIAAGVATVVPFAPRSPIQRSVRPATPRLAVAALRLDAFVVVVAVVLAMSALTYLTRQAGGSADDWNAAFLSAAWAGALTFGWSIRGWGRWALLVRLWLPLGSWLPWRLLNFLDDACQRGVLRRTGPLYWFRHASLQKVLAANVQLERFPAARAAVRAVAVLAATPTAVFVLGLVVQVVAAGMDGTADSIDGSSDLTGPNATIAAIVDVLSFIVGALAVVMIIVGGIRYVTSGGDASSVASAKSIIIYAIVGLLIALMAHAIVQLVLNKIIGG